MKTILATSLAVVPLAGPAAAREIRRRPRLKAPRPV